jgi:hypothetical protein
MGFPSGSVDSFEVDFADRLIRCNRGDPFRALALRRAHDKTCDEQLNLRTPAKMSPK